MESNAPPPPKKKKAKNVLSSWGQILTVECYHK